MPHRWSIAEAKAANAASVAARRKYASLRRSLPDVILNGLITAQHNALLSENGSSLPPRSVERLARIRKQLDRIDSLIEKETDPKKLRDLSVSAKFIAEQEKFILGPPQKHSKSKPPSTDII